MLLRMGLDVDGHQRITTGGNFVLLGGGEETHEEMVEKTIQIDGKLAHKGKQLEEVFADEFDEIARSVGLRRHRPPKPKQNNPPNPMNKTNYYHSIRYNRNMRPRTRHTKIVKNSASLSVN